MKQSMSKKIAAMGIAGFTGLAVIGSTLGSGAIVASAKTNEGAAAYENQDRVRPVTGGAVDVRDRVRPATGSAIEENDKVRPATGSAIKENDKVRPATGSAIEEAEKNQDKEEDKEKPATGSSAETSEKETNKKVSTVTKKVKVKKVKKTAKNKITITLNGTNTWSNVKVTVKTSSGKTVKAKIVKKTKNSCVIQTSKKLEKKTYVIKVKGVKVKGASKYETITTKVKVK